MKASRIVEVNLSQGIHARPADLIVRLGKQFESKIEFVKDNHRVDGKSILDLLTLAAVQGTQLTIEAEGPDAEAAVEALIKLFAEGLPESEQEHNQTTSD